MRLLHVVATGQRRGAEMFASDLIHALQDFGDYDQQVALLHGPWPPEVGYEAPVARMRASGRRLPFLRMDLATLSNLRGLIGRFRPDVVHAHGGEAFKYCAIGTPVRRTPLVYRRIGSAPNSIKHGMRRSVHAALLRRPDRIVAVADSVRKETIETFGVPLGRVVTIPRGVDPHRLAPVQDRTSVRAELGVPESAPMVVTVGALSAEKDPIAHLDLCASLRDAWSDIAYVLVGDGPMRREVHDAVVARGLERHVRVLGTRTDVGDLLRASDVLVLASHTEGMPGCVIEAGMAGIPVVAYGVAGVSEVLVDGVTGYVVRPGDRACLAERTSELLADPVRRAAMGRSAAERCRDAFDITGVARRYVDVYAGVTAT
ncbi:MAG: glycosyltransferase family 4 protein [Actinomycetota bacterium]